MSDDIRTELQGAWGVITLTRPKALNSLTKEMCEEIDRALATWADDGNVKAVLIEGEGDRAFCAGGDIRWLYDTGRQDPEAAATFFRSEYRLDTRIAHYPKPYVALMDGVCMGGGVGISMNASHRVVTERTVWAMPECGIGLIPDVGASYLLPRLPGGLGYYLSLTGARLEGADCLTAEIATHVVNSDEMTALRADLLALEGGDIDAAITATLNKAGQTRPGDLVDMLDTIRTYFEDVESIPALLESLKGNHEGFGAYCLDAIGKGSPTSVLLTHRLLQGAPESFDDCISREFNVTANILASHDFYEGVRAQIVDKDRHPKWQPDRLEEVEADALDRMFEEPKGGPLDLSGIA